MMQFRGEMPITGFDPRPRVRGDRLPCPVIVGHGCFDPRPRVRGDHMPRWASRITLVSIRAPA